MQKEIVVQKKGQQILEKELTNEIIAAAIEIHRALGPGLLESAYQSCLEHECRLRKQSFENQVQLNINYKGLKLDGGYRVDLIFDKRAIVEIKTVEAVLPVHEAQLLTYLRLTGIHVGLLINFNVPTLKNGIYRRVL